MEKKNESFFERIKSNAYYQTWFKNPLTYVAAAVLLSILQIVTFASTKNPLGITGTFANWGAWIFQLFGGSVDKWYYFAGDAAQRTLERGFLHDPHSWRNLGIIVGALGTTLLASGFKIKKIKSWRQVVAAAGGGLMMGYGARLAFGCNIGALYGGISSLSLSGWVFAVGMFLGAIVGSKLLVKYFM